MNKLAKKRSFGLFVNANVGRNSMRPLLIIMSFLLLSLSATAQQQIEQSDSIVLTSHLTTLNSLQVDALGKRTPPHKLLVNEELNNLMVKERVKLSHSHKVDLSSFLPKKRTDNCVEHTKCIIFFTPLLVFHPALCCGCTNNTPL